MKIIVVGAGWLGQQLLGPLHADGHQLMATRQSDHGLTVLSADIIALRLCLPCDALAIESLRLAFKQAMVICSVPPSWRKQQGQGYLESLASLAQLMQQSGSLACIHLSSSGVYQGLNGDVDEQSALLHTDAKASLLLQGEQILRQAVPCCTLRLGGLIGPNRHPGRFLSGRLLPDPDGAVNMVHSIDVTRAIQCIVQQHAWPAVFNVSCPKKVTRQQFYQKASAALQLPAPKIADMSSDPSNISRRVLATSICQQLKFEYQFRSALEALPYCSTDRLS